MSLAAVEEIAEAASRAEALARIAEAQASAGDTGEARNSLSRALAAAAGIDAAAYDGGPLTKSLVLLTSAGMAFSEQARVFSLIARVQADMGDTGEARKTFSRAAAAIEGIGDDHTRSAGLLEVAKMQRAAGALPEARSTLARADPANFDRRYTDPGELVRTQAEAGDIAGALATVRTIPGGEWKLRAQALSHVAAAQAAAGDEPGALVSAGEIESQYYRMRAMSSIGIARAERGDIAGAWDAVRKIAEIWVNPQLRDDMGGTDMAIGQAATISAIAEAHIAKGEFEKALATTEKMAVGYNVLEVHAAILTAAIAAGHFDTARDAVEELCTWASDTYRCAEALADLAAALSAAGSAEASREAASMALDAADGARYDPERIRAFVAAYKALMRVGDVEAARRAFSSALAVTTAEENEGAPWQAEELMRMGAAAAREGDSDSLNRLATSGEMVVRTLVHAGLAGTRAGHADTARATFSPAVATAMAFETAYRRAKSLAEIAFALASGRWPAADDYPGYFGP